MREEKYLEQVQRKILKSKKWQRFVREFDIGVENPKTIKALPIRFVFHIPGERGRTSQYMMQCLPDEIIVAEVYYESLSDNTRRLFMYHELLHHYLRTNGVPFDDHDNLFKEAQRYLGIDCEVHMIARYRRRTGKDRRWRF
jgi:hypothetical protein